MTSAWIRRVVLLGLAVAIGASAVAVFLRDELPVSSHGGSTSAVPAVPAVRAPDTGPHKSSDERRAAQKPGLPDPGALKSAASAAVEAARAADIAVGAGRE